MCGRLLTNWPFEMNHIASLSLLVVNLIHAGPQTLLPALIWETGWLLGELINNFEATDHNPSLVVFDSPKPSAAHISE